MNLTKLMRLAMQPHSTFLTIVMLLLLASGTLVAHHGWTGYEEKPITVTGTVKASGYENPHGFVDLQSSNKIWRVILAPPSRMEARGLTRDMLKSGTTATVVAYPHKTQSNELRAERITIRDKTTELR